MTLGCSGQGEGLYTFTGRIEVGSDGDKKEKCVQVRDRERIIVCPQALIGKYRGNVIVGK